MTRAKDELHIMLPQRFFTHGQQKLGDRHVYAQRTRFIPKGLLDLFERVGWPAVEAVAPAMAPPAEPRVDVAARLKSMWQ
jgi:DNA helicase-2/ATP-dependent DNA helicase PcrA